MTITLRLLYLCIGVLWIIPVFRASRELGGEGHFSGTIGELLFYLAVVIFWPIVAGVAAFFWLVGMLDDHRNPPGGES